jgi:hypothetical protein
VLRPNRDERLLIQEIEGVQFGVDPITNLFGICSQSASMLRRKISLTTFTIFFRNLQNYCAFTFFSDNRKSYQHDVGLYRGPSIKIPTAALIIIPDSLKKTFAIERWQKCHRRTDRWLGMAGDAAWLSSL